MRLWLGLGRLGRLGLGHSLARAGCLPAAEGLVGLRDWVKATPAIVTPDSDQVVLCRPPAAQTPAALTCTTLESAYMLGSSTRCHSMRLAAPVVQPVQGRQRSSQPKLNQTERTYLKPGAGRRTAGTSRRSAMRVNA